MRYRQNESPVSGTLESVALILTDVIVIYVSLLLAFIFSKYVGDYIFPNRPDFIQTFRFYFRLFWIPAVYIFLAAYNGLYTRNRIFWEDARLYIRAYVVAFIVVLTISAIYRRQGQLISRIVMVVYFFNTLWLSLVVRYGIVLLLHKVHLFRKKILIIGAGNTGINLLDALRKERYLGYEALGFVDDDPKKKGRDIQGVKVLGDVGSIYQINAACNVNKVFIAIPSLSSEKLMALYAKLHVFTKEVVIIPQIKGMALTNSEMHHLFNYDLPLLNVRNNLNYLANIFMKDIFDYFLVILVSPFFLVLYLLIACAIRIESKGPPIYKHVRYTMTGREIRVYKFRSMYVNADELLAEMLEHDEGLRNEWDESFKLKNDPRITRVGKFLRRSSLDELPQILNVLKGEMSFVGPRPVIKRELKRYYIRYSDFFHKVKPGITGLWQVSGRNDTKYNYRVRTDLWYVLNWSVWLDVVILFKTFGAVVRGSGAY